MGDRFDDERMPGINYKTDNKDKRKEEYFEEPTNEETYYEKEYDHDESYEDYEEDYSKYQKKKISISDVRGGYKTLKGQGKIFAYYILMVVSLLVVNALASRGIIPKVLQYVLLLAAVGFTFYKFTKQHENDEDTLN